MAVTATLENRTINIAGNRGIRATNRTASHGRRVRGVAPVRVADTRRVRVVTIMDRAAMTVAAVVADGACTRVRVVEWVGAVRAVSASGQ